MRTWFKKVAHFCQAEDGPTAVEYAVMLALIIVVCAATIAVLGGNTSDKFANQTLANALGS
jgi:pilus assembly protein Flp/PilA